MAGTPTKEPPLPPIPLRQRRYDWFFIIAFVQFFVSSFLTDTLTHLGRWLSSDGDFFLERIILETYALRADPLLIANPPLVQVSSFVSAFIWVPLYAVFALGFVRGWDWIRTPALIYGGALLHGMTVYMSEGLFGVHPSPNPALYLAANLRFWLVPLLLIVRMWRAYPFARQGSGVAPKT